MSVVAVAEPKTQPSPVAKPVPKPDNGWRVIVWNDPVNLMSYVVYVFQKVLGFDTRRARKHMLEVHEQGKSCVAQETRERAELYWQRIQQYGLKVTLERA
ncbi:MAG: ATP-dependent Clp protease adapter ClpS [Verrucomicrobiia bacterium]